MRLQKYMAHCGVASRRKCETMIEEGRVSVNGKIVNTMGVVIDPKEDVVIVDGRKIELEDRMIYIALNKPVGYISSVKDQFDRPTVIDLIDSDMERVYPVGRLDYDSEGLILLTNDGNLAYKLTHPKYSVPKEYLVVVEGSPLQSDLNTLRQGIYLDGSMTRPAIIEPIKINRDVSSFSVILMEGRNRQIRKMFDFISHPVISLQRVRIANILLKDLVPGQWRYLTQSEVDDLKDSVKGG